jgi:hypothetical protein
MSLQEFKAMLLTITSNVFHYQAYSKLDKYIVWAEDSESDASYADDKKVDQITQGTIDYYTKLEFDPMVKSIQDKLTENEISWTLASVQYEEDTKYIHHEWLWEVDMLG